MIRKEEGNGELVYNKMNQNWRTDIQKAINDGNRRQDAFFIVRVGKSSCTSFPFQQSIPMDFARAHPELQEEVVTLESRPSSLEFRVAVLRHWSGMRFGKGWRQFSLQNHLQEGYQLLFNLVRELHFEVTFYDHRGKTLDTSFPPLAPQPLVGESLKFPKSDQGSPPVAVAATTGSGYRGVGDDSARGNAAGEEGSMETLRSDHRMSRAMRLLQQQGCIKFSEIIVSEWQQQRDVSDEDRSRAVKAATRFASELQNAKFMAVMRDTQVYHGFHLPIPREILEETGTLQPNKVQVCLTDRENAFYVANWAWHAFCETPLLNTDGWAKFALDHTLEEGDVCVFELSELTEFGPALVFCVHIFRVVEADGGAHTPLHSTLGKKSEAEELDLRLRKRPIADLGSPSHPRKARSANKLQPLWTKLIKPRMQGHSGRGSRGQSSQM